MASTSTPTTPQTLLEAVNDLLEAVRISPIMSLNAADLNDDAAGAKQALDGSVREVLLRGWVFNTDVDYVLDPEPGTGNINLPQNTLKFSVERSDGNRYVLRGQRLYDPIKHTYAFEGSVTGNLTVSLPFEELPEAFKRYCTGLAARRWCLPRLPSGATFQYTDDMVKSALALAETQEAEMADVTLKDTSPHFAQFARGRRRYS
jgi:hypothetical protein